MDAVFSTESVYIFVCYITKVAVINSADPKTWFYIVSHYGVFLRFYLASHHRLKFSPLKHKIPLVLFPHHWIPELSTVKHPCPIESFLSLLKLTTAVEELIY